MPALVGLYHTAVAANQVRMLHRFLEKRLILNNHSVLPFVQKSIKKIQKSM
jgi:hypothetical protein